MQEDKISMFMMMNSKYFEYPINRVQSLEQLDYFCEYLLMHFGDFE